MGKTIRVYLVDGVPSGVRTAEVGNWTGSVLVAPRSRVADVSGRPEVRRTGVYFLVGDDPTSTTRKSVYVGEADNVFDRLRNHNRDESKDFWTETVIVTSKDSNLTKAHARYMESQLIRLAHEAGRASVKNSTAPTGIALPEADVSDMTEFLNQLVIVLPVLGFAFLQPSTAKGTESIEARTAGSPIFELSQGKFWATAREIDGEFIVLKGSKARLEAQPSWTFFKAGREALVDEGKIIDCEDPELLIFDQDVPFSSPSAAAAAVLARNANGRTSWKVRSTGESYQEWMDNQLTAASDSENATSHV